MALNKNIEAVFDIIIKSLSLLCLSAYVISALGLDFIPDKYLLPFVLILGTMAILALANMYFKYSFDAKDLPYYKVGTLLMVLAFFQFTTMLVIQQATVFALAKADSNSAFALINSIQLGMDVVFDIFYSVGIILISISLIIVDSKSLTGWYGILIAPSLLILNLYSFPMPPKESGIIDLGIFTLPWWLFLVWKIKKTNYGENFR